MYESAQKIIQLCSILCKVKKKRKVGCWENYSDTPL